MGTTVQFPGAFGGEAGRWAPTGTGTGTHVPVVRAAVVQARPRQRPAFNRELDERVRTLLSKLNLTFELAPPYTAGHVAPAAGRPAQAASVRAVHQVEHISFDPVLKALGVSTP